MPRGDKLAYTDKQRRQAHHVEEGYEKRGVPEKEAERRAWAKIKCRVEERSQGQAKIQKNLESSVTTVLSVDRFIPGY